MTPNPINATFAILIVSFEMRWSACDL